MVHLALRSVVLLQTLGAVALAQTASTSTTSAASSACPSTLTPGYPAPSVASGYSASLIAQQLTKPRGIKFDTSGNLLVVEQGKGITALTLTSGNGDCVMVSNRTEIISDSSVSLSNVSYADFAAGLFVHVFGE